jgi:hypothetical protein
MSEALGYCQQNYTANLRDTTLVPYWDEWTATADLILKPWHRHRALAALWAPHNDHRVVLTRLWE